MPQVVELSDGTELEFPDEMSREEMRGIMQRKFPKVESPAEVTPPVPPMETAAESMAKTRALIKESRQAQMEEAAGRPSLALTIPEALQEPVLSPSQLMPRNPIYPSKPGSFRRGLEEFIGETGSALTTPTVAGAVAMAPLVPEVVGPAFAYQGLKDVPEATKALYQAKTDAETAKNAARILMDAAMLSGIKGLKRPGPLWHLTEAELARMPGGVVPEIVPPSVPPQAKAQLEGPVIDIEPPRRLLTAPEAADFAGVPQEFPTIRREPVEPKLEPAKPTVPTLKPERGLPETATESDLMADMTQAGRNAYDAAKAKPDEFHGVDVTDLSRADRRNLNRLGLSITEDRSGRVIATYPARLRAEDLRKAVQAKQTLNPPAKAQAEVTKERLQISPRTDGMVNLHDSSGHSIGTFKTVDEAGKAAIDLGYDIAPGSQLKPSWTVKPQSLVDAEQAAKAAFEKLGAAERGAYDKSKRKGMTKAMLAKLEAFDNLVEAEQKAKAEWKASQTGPQTISGAPPSAEALGIVPPGVAQVSQLFSRFKKAIQSVLAPATVDASAGQTAGIIRERGAVMHREWIQAREALKSAKKMFDRQDNARNLDFIDRMENGRTQATPQLQAISQQLRDALNDPVRRVRALGTGRLQQVIENYFPHIWKDPQAAANIFQRIFAKRPFEGPKAFLKRRSLPTTADGIANGLEPVSYNPVELTMLKLHEIDRYIMAHEVLNEMKDQGLARFVRFGQRAPDGYAKIDDKIAQVIQMQPTTLVSGAPGAPQAVLRGNYYAPEAAARVLNNYLSPGLRGNIIYDTLRAAGNALNQAQLGLSAYHLTFTGIDSATSKVALGAEQIARGQFLRGAAYLAKGTIGNLALYAPIENYIKGNKVLREYTKPGSVGGEFTDVVNSLIRAGGRVEMDTFYKNSALESFWKAFREGGPQGYGKALWKAPWALLEAASKPVMEIWVPRMKLGIFYDMARAEMERMPGASPEQLREAMGKAWDSVDNRMGQMVYDNLFWNKTLKDLSMLGVRSVGWNLGTLRELGGGVLDSATVLKRLQAGDPVLTHRMAYLIALPITVGTMGAMYQYLATGKGPEKLEDYFLPKNGQKRADGSDERIILPSYMKDVLPLVKASKEKGGWGAIGRLERMAVNKASPWISLVGDMLSNKDFYGRPIANPEDPLVKQVASYAEFIRQQFKPFSFRAYEKQSKEGLGTKIQSFAGLQPAPPELQPTATREIQQKARQFMAKRGIVHSPSPISDYHDLRQALEVGDDEKAMEQIQKLRKGRSDLVIFEAFERARTHPFTGSLANERRFRATLTPEEQEQYLAARRESQAMFKKFRSLWSKRGSRKS